ncbi:putative phosphoglycerate mutase pmu1 [Neonectria punicea]|uniref:Phosphoglycerate mutase pmu1 n=1 Tax=Neonectria punicea TaxID=979145 RepID=A0ABR1GQR6_9HYPO
MRFTVLTSLLTLTPAVLADWRIAKGREIEYSSVEGFFLQDNSSTDAASFDYANWNFGLVNRTYTTDPKHKSEGFKDGYKTQWERFEKYVDHLNRKAPKDTQYKVLVMGRHGEGWHNAAETYYGTPAWNCYWSLQTGNGTANWEDPLLTDAGLREALKANAYFKSRFEDHGMPPFESYYTSPLARCVITARETFANLRLPSSRRFEPVVKESFREGVSIHTCDHRSSRAYISTLSPRISFERGFAEHDELWTGDEGETAEHQLARSKAVLDDVFVRDDATWVSITSHSGEISKLLTTLNHRAFRLSTGQIIPVLVKAKLVREEPTATYVSWTTEATCHAPPMTSISGQGCVCSGTTTLASTAATATA